MSKAYLALYNVASAAGWAYILSIVVQSWMAGLDAAGLWAAVGPSLKLVQSAAFLEVLHAYFKLVRSPVGTTALQVASRLALVWAYTNTNTMAQSHWSLYLMAGSWATVEVPRYLFYAANLFMSSAKVPFPLFWLRYSLFMILYPTGISGEILQIVASLPWLREFHSWGYVASRWLLLMYAPGGPFMIFFMFMQRGRAFKNRKNAARGPKPKPQGILFPITNEKTDERSTSKTNQEIWARSLDTVNPEGAAAVRKQRGWRFGYAKHVVKHVECAVTSEKAAVGIARAGLEAVHEMFTFEKDGEVMSVKEAAAKIKDTFKYTGELRGEEPVPRSKVAIPYKGKDLTGDEIKAQLDQWVKQGTIEPSAADSINRVVDNKAWVDLSDEYFVLCGATSMMGPLYFLLAHGANVIALDLDRTFIWNKLIKAVRASPGRIIFPMKKAQADCKDDDELAQNSGCNLLTQAVEIKNWLLNVAPGKRLTIGAYAYLDGALHTQLSVAMDVIIGGVCEKRRDTVPAYLCTPTDAHVHPAEAVEAAASNWKRAPLYQKVIRGLAGIIPGCGRILKRNTRRAQKNTDSGKDITVVDGIVVAQGPNYALAKRIQHWRAVVSRANGHFVSTNVAPSTATPSVTSNKFFALAYEGWRYFSAMEVFQPDTSNAVMGAMLIHDIRHKGGVADPATKLVNPMALFAGGSLHGGIWRCAYTVTSFGSTALFLALFANYAPFIIGGTAVAVYGANYILTVDL